MKLIEKLLKNFKGSQEDKQETNIKNNPGSEINIFEPKFETIKEITPRQIEAKAFYEQFTAYVNNGHNLYISTPVFVSPLNKNGEIAKNDAEKVESVVNFTHKENDAICGKFNDKYYRYFNTDNSMQIYYFQNKEDELVTTSISVQQNGDCIENVCVGENNSLVDSYQRMAHAVDIRINIMNNTEFQFDNSPQQ